MSIHLQFDQAPLKKQESNSYCLDPIAINAPFEGLIQINLEILNETGSAQEFFDAEVSATLIIED